jgi:DNA polymerase I-like protein with 3'-5' exonuclease and polymerase domains
MDDWLRSQARSVLSERTARTLSGRIARMRFDENDRGEVGAAQRYAKNMPIQGTSADILKRALRLLHDELRGTSAKLVNIVHDEIVVEADANEAEETARKLERSMLAAGREFLRDVPVKVDLTVSDEWCK